MKIAYICTDFGIPVHGTKGASIHVRELSQAFHELGHAALILAPRAGGAAPPGFDVPVWEFAPDPAEKIVCDLLRADPAAEGRMAKELRSLLYTSALPHRVRERLRDFAPELVYERYSLWGTSGVTLARELQIPLLLEVNAPLSDEQAEHRGLVLAETARGLERLVLRAADQLIAVSDAIERWLVASGVEPARVMVIPNAVDMSRWENTEGKRRELRSWLGIAGASVIGFVGTLKPWHGTATLIRAVAYLHRRGLKPRLLVVGDGPERPGLQELAECEGIAHAMLFAGAVPHEHVPAYVAAMDVAVAPYDRADNFYFSPLKLFEYMASGRPVVAADVGQVRDFVRHGETGWLYPPGNVQALADGIAALLNDAGRAVALGHAARSLVASEHTWRHRAEQILAAAADLKVDSR